MSYNPMCALFEELFPEHNFRWQPSGNSMKAFCPFHENNRSRAMVVYEDAAHRWHWYCFTDQFGGLEVHAVMRALNLSRANANRWLIKKGKSPESEIDLEAETRHERLAAFLAYSNRMLRESEEAAGLRAYLVSRGISAAHISKFPIGYYKGLDDVRSWCIDNDIPEDAQDDFLPRTHGDKWEGSIAFFYRNAFERINRIKVRNVLREQAGGDKITLFLGKKAKFEGYFAATQQSVLSDHAVVVEGEFDVLALYSLVLREDPDAYEMISCFSGGSNMVKGVDSLKDLGVDRIYIFPDNDVAGIEYVNGIADLHPHTYVMAPKDYKDKEDPAEWAKMHDFKALEEAYKAAIPAYTWIGRMYAKLYSDASVEDQSDARVKILAYAKKLLPVAQEVFLAEFAPMTGASLEALKEELLETTTKKYKKVTRGVDFGVSMQWKSGKTIEWQKIANFIPEHEYDILYDDGNPNKEMERSYAIRLLTKDRVFKVKVSNAEYNDDKRLQTLYQAKLGSLGQVAPKMISYLRDASLSFFAEDGVFREDLIYSHTGWNNGKYLMPNCYIDAENGYQPLGDLTVELPPSLGVMFPYGLQQPYNDFSDVKKVIREDLLKMFPYSVTLPSIAHVFLTPLLEFMPDQSPYALWLHGITGTFKSTFSSMLLAFFGKNNGANGLISINSTVNAIEKMGYHLKDVLVVLDDYKKSTVRDDLLVRLIQNYGGRQGRSRLNNRSELQQTYYIRGNVVITGEDQPAGESSVTARTLLIPIPCYPDMDRLNRCQANAHHFPSLYAKYIEFILEKRRTVDFSQLCGVHQRSKFSTVHHRVNTNLMLNSIGWEFFAEFMGFQDLTEEYYKSTEHLANYMNVQTKAEQASEIFLEAIFDMLSSGWYYIEGRKGMMDTPHNDKARIFGYRDKESVYIKGSDVMAEMNKKRKLTHNSVVQFSPQAIYDQLKREGMIDSDPDNPDKNTMKKKISGISTTVLKFKASVFDSLNDTEYAEQKK